MAEQSGYKHSASDKKLDQSAESANETTQTTDTQHSSGAGGKQHASAGHHDEEKIRQHDDDGKDRLFEKREQHDDAERSSERNRLAKDVAKHDHDIDGNHTDPGTSDSTGRKS